MLKKQENVIIEMERAVYKRESIQVKYDNKGKEKKEMTASKSGTNGDGNDKSIRFSINFFFILDYSQVKKQISQLKQTLNQSTVNAKQIDSAVKDKQVELNNVRKIIFLKIIIICNRS